MTTLKVATLIFDTTSCEDLKDKGSSDDSGIWSNTKPDKANADSFFTLCREGKKNRHVILSPNFISACRTLDDLSVFIPVFILKNILTKALYWSTKCGDRHGNTAIQQELQVPLSLQRDLWVAEVLIGGFGEKCGGPDARAWGWCRWGQRLRTGCFGHLRRPQGGMPDLQCSFLWWKKRKMEALMLWYFTETALKQEEKRHFLVIPLPLRATRGSEWSKEKESICLFLLILFCKCLLLLSHVIY